MTSLASHAIAAAHAHQPSLNAFTQIFDPADVDLRDKRPAINDTLSSTPIAIKDNICTTQGLTTAGSRILANYRSPFAATAVARLEAAGVAIIAKTNMDEFGMGSSTEHSPFGPTSNPWSLDHVPGGSSGGSAAAVAARIVPAALGSDTGGSIRQPASHCGVVGLKPTYGRVSRFGLVAYASSLDCIGPITANVRLAAAILQTIAGEDPHDSTSSRQPVPNYLATIDEPIPDLRIGLVRSMLTEHNHQDVNAAVERTAGALRLRGATIVDVDLPTAPLAIDAYYIVATAEASSNLARYDGVRYGVRAALAPSDSLDDLYTRSRSQGFGREVQRRIMLGAHVLSAGYYDAYYLRALKTRRLIKQDYDRAFSEHRVHALLMPASPGPAFRRGEKLADPLALYLEDIYTVGINLAGLPAITIPVATTSATPSLPIGVQLVARPFDEQTLLAIARAAEAELDFQFKPAI
ncbi:MAG: Asp-tRNA(Asn)/Glu-tRNA(Gln) amidotransferase subunit GatA [Phycisphaeraceae bacterium]|nr:Asp-tRNA(Asn)/Glu-tRNA(Gln) amidotransferase subunit GatA [Phycisphaeraceae bacterium]MCW5763669.1 Asp-tRNA(Asn)/Glu-tRNA(Gln) amidotransferase subunit GatA [Phycisphaeraceae bacterium]